MNRKRVRLPIVALGVAAAMSIGAGQSALAHSQPSQGPPQGNATGGNGSGHGPGTPGKMGSTKNSERWAAAIRGSDRNSEDVRKNGDRKKKGKKD